MNNAKLLLVGAVILSSCAGAPGGNWIGANTPNDVGTLPDDYVEQIKNRGAASLKDPYSAVWQIGSRSDAQIAQCAIGIYGQFNGWRVPVCVNAKNSYGGYTGNKCGFAWFANGRLQRGSDYPALCP